MTTRLLFVCDPLEGFATYKDSTFAMMRECQLRGIEIHSAHPHELRAHCDSDGNSLSVFAHHIRIDDPEAPIWWVEDSANWQDARTFTAIVMRKDPPFDAAYLICTQFLDIAERQGVPVVNRPQALRDHGEKMAALEFPQFTPPTLVSCNIKALREFAAHQGKIVIKPLDAMGGQGIFVLDARDPNLPSALEVLSDNGRRSIVAQRYLPEIIDGDKRIIVIDGQAIPAALARIPPDGHSRGNLAAGGRGVVMALTAREQEIADVVGRELAPRGLVLMGLDVIGGYLTEINVTSPTGFQEISRQANIDVAARFIDAVLNTR